MQTLRVAPFLLPLALAGVVFACSSDDGAVAVLGRGADGGSSGDSGAALDGDGGSSSDGSSSGADGASRGDAGGFVLTSSAFVDEGAIPVAHTCVAGSSEASPPLAWSGAPSGTRSFAVIVRDLSVLTGDDFHWIIYDLPVTTTSLPAGVAKGASLTAPITAKQAIPSFDPQPGYDGPCPPAIAAAHRYEFRVYALSVDQASPLTPTDRDSAELAITANAIASAHLEGTFERP